MAHNVRLKTLTIPITGTDSNVIDMVADFADCVRTILIQAPAVLDAGAYSIMVSSDNVVFATLCGSDGTTALAVPAATKAKAYQFEIQGAMFWKIVQVGAAGANRVFLVSGQEEYT